MNAVPQQRGFVMVVGLIMLVMMTLLAMAALGVGRSSLRVVDNMQQRSQALTADQEALDAAISTSLFTSTPTAVFNSTNCPSTMVNLANVFCVDVNGDGKTLETVTLTTPTCIKAQVITNAQLDPVHNLADRQCTVGQSGDLTGMTGGSGGTSDASLCSNTTWSMATTATEPSSEVQVTLEEGVGVRTSTANLLTFCP